MHDAVRRKNATTSHLRQARYVAKVRNQPLTSRATYPPDGTARTRVTGGGGSWSSFFLHGL